MYSNHCCLMLTAGDLKGPDVKAEGGSLTGKLAAGTAAVGAALGAGAMALSGKGSGSADVKVGCQFPKLFPPASSPNLKTHTRPEQRPPAP